MESKLFVACKDRSATKPKPVKEQSKPCIKSIERHAGPFEKPDLHTFYKNIDSDYSEYKSGDRIIPDYENTIAPEPTNTDEMLEEIYNKHSIRSKIEHIENVVLRCIKGKLVAERKLKLAYRALNQALELLDNSPLNELQKNY